MPRPYDSDPEEHWSPEPIVAYRRHFDSLQGQPFDYRRAGCRTLEAWIARGYSLQDARLRDALHDSPKWDCTCGYYGMKDYLATESPHLVAVLMYGIVIEHAWGYRAEYMEPAAVISIGESCKCESCQEYPLRIQRRFAVPRITNPQVIDYVLQRAKAELTIKLEALSRVQLHPQPPSTYSDQQRTYNPSPFDPNPFPRNS